MQKKLHLAFAAALLTTTSLTNAYAQENTSTTTTTEEVTVYATRSAQSTFSVPAIVDIIDTDEAANANANDLQDLLEFVPNVEVVNGPRRSSQTIAIRGFDDESLIILMDGRRQNLATGHDGRMFVDPSLLKKVEIVKGSASSIYGGGAVGGVVAFETKDAADLLRPGETLGAQTMVGYGSGSRDKTSSVSAYGRQDGWDILASANYRDAGSIEQGNDQKLHSNDEIQSFLFKSGYTFDDFHTISFNVQSLEQESLEPNNSAGSITSSNPLVEKDISDDQFGLKYAYENPENNWLSPKVHFYFNDTSTEEYNISGSNLGRRQTREMETIGLTIDNQSKLAIDDSQSHTLSYGFEIYQDEQVGKSNVNGGVYSGVPNAEAENYGLYIQDEITGYNGDSKITLTPAIRYDSYKSNDDQGNSQNEHSYSPKFALAVEPTKNYMLFGSWSRAFRAPAMTELYPSGTHFPGNTFTQNPDLRPEIVTTMEIGAGVSFDKVFASNDKIKVKGSHFWSDGKDFISQSVNFAGGTTDTTNVDKAEIDGWEVQADYNIDSITALASLSTTKAVNGDTGAYLDQSVPLTMTTGMSYKARSIDSEFGFKAKFAEENRRVSSSNSTTDGYGVLDIFYRWTPEFADDNLTLDLGVNNVTDKAYAANYASLYEEGRSVVGKVSYKW